MPRTKKSTTSKTAHTKSQTSRSKRTTRANSSKTASQPRKTGRAKSRSAEEAAEEIVQEHGPDTVTLDRRHSGSSGSKNKARRKTDRRQTTSKAKGAKAEAEASPERPKLEPRPKVQRRRQIDPTTCERDYSAEEIEFMVALDEYKRASGRMFPTCSEILEVLRKLGYEKRCDAVSGTSEPAPADGAEDVAQGEAADNASEESLECALSQ